MCTEFEILLIIKNLNSNLAILKLNLYIKLNIKQITFNELENEIDDFIHYYNNVRIRENLNWMTPTQYRNHF